MMLVHLASALGRIQRGHCVSPLYADFLAEIQSAVVFRKFYRFIKKYWHTFRLPFPKKNKPIFSPMCMP